MIVPGDKVILREGLKLNHHYQGLKLSQDMIFLSAEPKEVVRYDPVHRLYTLSNMEKYTPIMLRYADARYRNSRRNNGKRGGRVSGQSKPRKL